MPPERLAELEQVAAISAAVAAYIISLSEVKALTLQRAKRGISPWILAGRQNLAEHGG